MSDIDSLIAHDRELGLNQNEVGFEVFRSIVYDKFAKDINLDKDGIWFEANTQFKLCKGIMTNRDHQNSFCSDSQTGWFYQGFCKVLSKYDGSEQYFGTWDNGCPNGYGFEKGYFGYFKNGLRHGEGVRVLDNQVYMGEFHLNWVCGKGTFYHIYDQTVTVREVTTKLFKCSVTHSTKKISLIQFLIICHEYADNLHYESVIPSGSMLYLNHLTKCKN